MGYGCGTKIIKLVLFTFNFAAWAASLCLLGFGIWMVVECRRFDSLFAEDHMKYVAGLILFLGALGSLVGFSGCCGAIQDNICLLRTYFIFMLLIVLGEISAGTMTFVYRTDIEYSMTIGMTKAIESYYGVKPTATEAIDAVQRKFICCGATDYRDYDTSFYRYRHGELSLPDTCCLPEGSCYAESFKMKEEGCVEESKKFLQDNILILGVICFGFILFEIMAMFFACCLIESVKEDYYI